MGEKKNDGGNNNKNNGGNGGKKDKQQTLTVVLKVDMHCDGCASKIAKHLRRFDGVETVKTETAANKVTVVGIVDPAVLRDQLSQKTKKKVDLISPQPKKAENNQEKKEKKPEKEKTPDEIDAGQKKKETPAVTTTTAVLKLSLHCQGCIHKIRRTISKTKGVKEVSVDGQKELVTVKGTMDVKALAEILKEKLKRPVEIVPPKKEGGDNNGNGGGGGGKKKNKDNDGGGNGKLEGNNKVEHNNQQFMMIQPGFGYPYEQGGGGGGGYYPPPYYPPPPTYAPPVYPVQLHAPQIFSDENPNACSIM